jgi:hypothetical protein
VTKPKVPVDVLKNPPATATPATKPPATPGDGTQDVGSPAAETRPPCAPPHDPWTVCRNHQLLQCKQALSHFGPLVCNYREHCANSGRWC